MISTGPFLPKLFYDSFMEKKGKVSQPKSDSSSKSEFKLFAMNNRLDMCDSHLAVHTYCTSNRETMQKMWLWHKLSFFSSMRVKQ